MNSTIFIKLLIILSILSMILLLSVKIKERFSSNTNLDEINLRVDINANKDVLHLKWNNSNKDIKSFFIIMYKNNIGPYIITLPHITKQLEDNRSGPIEKNIDYFHNITDISMGSEYKLAIIGTDIYGAMSTINNYVNAKVTPNNLEVNYANDIKTKIYCNADGSYVLKNRLGECQKSVDVIQAVTYDENGNEQKFNSNYHDMMMRDLKNSPNLSFNFY